MKTHRTYVRPRTVARRRRSPTLRLELFAPPPTGRTASTTDDVKRAEQRVADLLALIDFGRVTSVNDLGVEPRYAIADGSDPHESPQRHNNRSEMV